MDTYSPSQLFLDVGYVDGRCSEQRFVSRYRSRYPERLVVRVDLLYELDDDGVGTAFGVVYTKRDARHVARAPYTAADLVVKACTYPEEMTRAEIVASAKTEYKRLQFLKLKYISKDAGIYVVALYAKKPAAR